jgi:hypothetical protein
MTSATYKHVKARLSARSARIPDPEITKNLPRDWDVCSMADLGVKARRESITHIAIDLINCRAAGDTPAYSTAIHHDRRGGKEANERGEGSLPDDIDIHVCPPGSRPFVRHHDPEPR